MRPARPKNLATKMVAWPCASELSIQCRHGRRIHVSLHPFRSTRHPLQLIYQEYFDFILYKAGASCKTGQRDFTKASVRERERAIGFK